MSHVNTPLFGRLPASVDVIFIAACRVLGASQGTHKSSPSRPAGRDSGASTESSVTRARRLAYL